VTLRRFLSLTLLLFVAFVAAQRISAFTASFTPDSGDYEGRIVSSIEIVIEGSPRDEAAEAEFRSLLNLAPGAEYRAVKVRESLESLFQSGLISNARVEVDGNCGTGGAATASLCVRFIVQRQLKVGEVRISLEVPVDSPISEDEMRTRLNMLEPGARLSEQVLKSNADLIQVYLRDKGFYRADVSYTQVRDAKDATGTRQTVVFSIEPNNQATVASFLLDIKGFDPSSVRPKLKLQEGTTFTRAALGEDLTRIREAIIANGFLAPQLEDERFVLDPDTNQVAISLKGGVGPKVEVVVKNYALKDKTLKQLLPIKREGNIDVSTIVEGERRLRNKIQENGYFFAEVNRICTVTPPVSDSASINGTAEMCDNLNPGALTGHAVTITYEVEPGRRFKLTDIRIEGTNELRVADVEDELRTQRANALGFIPLLGYGRGYTSRELLEQDRRTIEARMRDLGYRRVAATVRQGVSLEGG